MNPGTLRSARSARAGTAQRALSPPFFVTARFRIRVNIKLNSGVELVMERRRSTAYTLSSMKWRRVRGGTWFGELRESLTHLGIRVKMELASRALKV